MKYYISGALQASRDLDDARKLYNDVARILEKEGVTAFLPHKQTDPVWAVQLSSDDVFKRDVNAIDSCDAVVAFLNEPSHGVGAEVAMCLGWEKPLLPFLHESKSCSRFLEGLIRSYGGKILRYRNTRDLETRLGLFVVAHQQRESRHDRSLSLLYGA